MTEKRWRVERFLPACFDGADGGWKEESRHSTRAEAEDAAKVLRARKRGRMQYEQDAYRVRERSEVLPENLTVGFAGQEQGRQSKPLAAGLDIA